MRRGDGSLYDLTVPGYKANLSDVLAAIALVQLDKLERHAEIRARQFALYDEGLADLDGIEPLSRDPRDTHALHLYVVRVDADRFGLTRDELQRALGEQGVSTSIHFLPVHRLTWYRERFPEQPRLPVAERAGDQVLSLPLSPAHPDEDIEAVDRGDPPRAARAHETARPRLRDARLHRPRGRLPGLEDQPRQDARRPSRRRPRLVRPRCRDHGADRAADGAPLAVAARRTRDARLVRVADARLLRLVHRGPDPPDGDRRRRRADPRDLPAAPGPRRRSPAIVLLERGLGGAATCFSGAIGFVLAIGRYEIGAYLWLEGAFVVRDARPDRRSSSPVAPGR